MSKVDFAIITAKREEFEAVLKRFPMDIGSEFEKSLGKLRRPYTFRAYKTTGGINYVLAIARGVFQGLAEAQNLTTDFIEDLHPRWILFVGIGGGVPSDDLFLGDIVLATHVHDFSLGADTPTSREYAVQGYPSTKSVGTLVASLSGKQADLGEWYKDETIGYSRPNTPNPNQKLTGNAEWDERIRKAIRFHSNRTFPKFVDGPIASSDDLLKDQSKLIERLQVDRRIIATEMEAAGVAKACARHDDHVPFLPIRCISDIVGLLRDQEWTHYACEVAASFTVAFINLGFLSDDIKPQLVSSPAAESSASSDMNGIEGLFEILVAPFPMEILNKLIYTSSGLLCFLDDLIASEVLSRDSDIIFRGKNFNVPFAERNVSETFVERSLTALLGFVDRRGRELAGIVQCGNALALFERLNIRSQRLLAPRFFDVLDRPMKALGNKKLVEQVAKLCVAVSDHSDRTKEEAECEARARICGLSWVYQRTGRFDLAADEAVKGLTVSESLHIQKNLAFCNKCLGRLSRMRAEVTSNPEDKNIHLKKSVECLVKAIEEFSNLPEYGNEDPEVGDCYSLLARTYLVAEDLIKAEQYTKEATTRIIGMISKDYLDLQILLGDLAERRGRRNKAIAYYTKVVDTQIDNPDFQLSEIVARALTQRAKCFSRSAPDKAIRDFRTASDIWKHYQDHEPSAEAEWQAILLSEKFSPSSRKILEKEPATNRVEAFRRFEQKSAAKNSGTLSRRVGHDDIVWKQILKKVREDRALHREE